MKYLITGCAGFIGSRVCEMLLAEGHEVTGIDDLSGERSQERVGRLSAVTFQEYDICNGMVTTNTKHDAVIHLAAMAGIHASVENPTDCERINVMGTLAVLDMCRFRQIPKLVLVSSSSVYGRTTGPTHETADTTHPLSPYAASKVAAESLAYSYHHLYGLDVSVVRPFTVYGPHGRPDMSVDRFIRAIDSSEPITIYGDGTQTRDFTFVDDVARGIIASLRPVGFEAINLGADNPVSVADVLAMLETILGKSAAINYQPARSADVPQTWAEILKADRLLSWSPKVCLIRGLQQAIQSYRGELCQT